MNKTTKPTPNVTARNTHMDTHMDTYQNSYHVTRAAALLGTGEMGGYDCVLWVGRELFTVLQVAAPGSASAYIVAEALGDKQIVVDETLASMDCHLCCVQQPTPDTPTDTPATGGITEITHAPS